MLDRELGCLFPEEFDRCLWAVDDVDLDRGGGNVACRGGE